MPKNNKDFFKAKNSWSEIKDRLLGCYLPQYFQKILMTRRPIFYVDCFAGKGKFEDGNDGSPRIALKVRGECIARTALENTTIETCFIDLNYASELSQNIFDYQVENNITVISGKYEEKIEGLLSSKRGYNTFLYIDPYGIRAWDYALFDKFLTYGLSSIEMLINMNTFGFFRDACRVMKVDITKIQQDEAFRDLDEVLVEFTYNSNAIEGNTLTLQETALVLEGVTIDQKPLKDHLEAVGHKDAFLYVQSVVSQGMSIAEKTIKQIHSLVLVDRPEDKGVYRRIPVKIMGAVHEPPQPYLIEPQMNELLRNNEQNKKVMHPIERIAKYHLDFEGIHPFIDGNGRTGRLVLNLDLMQNGYPPVNVKFTDRRKHYEAFDAYYRDNNAGDMINLISGYVSERLKQYLLIIN